MSGAVGSMPSFTRSGRPSPAARSSLRSSSPCGQRIDGVSLQECCGCRGVRSGRRHRRPMLDSRLPSGWPCMTLRRVASLSEPPPGRVRPPLEWRMSSRITVRREPSSGAEARPTRDGSLRRGGRPAARPGARGSTSCASPSPCSASTLLALVSTVFGMMMAVAQDLPELESQNEFKAAQVTPSCYDRPGGKKMRLATLTGCREPHPGRHGRHLVEREARRGRDRGPALLHSTRASTTRASPARCGTTCAGSTPRRAPRRSRSSSSRTRCSPRSNRSRLPEAEGGGARLPARAQVDQGQDPHRVPEHRVLRRGRVRHRVGRARLLRLEPPRLRAATARPSSTPPRRRCSPG